MSLFSKFTSLFTRGERAVVDWNDLEQTLIGADLGPALAQRVSTRLHDARDLSLPDALAELLSPAERSLQIATDGPTVILIVGVNGSGKTTSIGKLSGYLARQGKSVLVVAADTFRAAAREQLQTWAQRTGVTCIAGKDGADPAAVAFDGVSQGRAPSRADSVARRRSWEERASVIGESAGASSGSDRPAERGLHRGGRTPVRRRRWTARRGMARSGPSRVSFPRRIAARSCCAVPSKTRLEAPCCP